MGEEPWPAHVWPAWLGSGCHYHLIDTQWPEWTESVSFWFPENNCANHQLHLSTCPVLPPSLLPYICCFLELSLKTSCSQDSPSEPIYWGPTWRHKPTVRNWGSRPTPVLSPTLGERGQAGAPQSRYPMTGTGKQAESASASLPTLRPLFSSMWLCCSLSPTKSQNLSALSLSPLSPANSASEKDLMSSATPRKLNKINLLPCRI